MNPHTRIMKKALGAYYTPLELSQVLADWAIKTSNDTILEPSFGGCVFLESSINTLHGLGCSFPLNNLYGVDIDDHAFDILKIKITKNRKYEKKFILNDFIRTKPENFLINNFDVIIGNPPYVSMHNMTVEQREACDNILKNSPYSTKTLGRNASLWAFFLLHSLTFLRNGGRVAWVLPSSLLNADYAIKLLDIYKKSFSKIKLIKLSERFFKADGIQESSIILLAENFNNKSIYRSNLLISSVENVEKLRHAINNSLNIGYLDVKDYKLDLVSSKAKLIYLSIINRPSTKELGFYADIKIGMVTGANSYFIINREKALEYNLPDTVLEPVVSKFSNLIGLIHNQARHKINEHENKRVLLVKPTEFEMNKKFSKVESYFSLVPDDFKNNNRTFKKRPFWFHPGWGIDGIKPDCFLSYMTHLGPRMVVNCSKQFNCTNSIHKVLFHSKVSYKYKLAICVTMLSTFTQLSAEIEGRAYSSGVLKIEPSAGKKIKILFSEAIIDELVKISNLIEHELKRKSFINVAKLVDDVLIQSGLISESECRILTLAIESLRNERYLGVKK